MRNVMITGPSSGIGRAASVEMGRRGFHVIAAGRSADRIAPVVDQIIREGGSAEHLQLDLSSLESVRLAVDTFVGSGRPLEVLVDNAGVGGVRGLTEDGFEIHFGVNHLGHFMLTLGLQPALPPGARIVVVSSEMHRQAGGVDLDNARRKTRSPYGYKEYGVSKLANILFSHRLAQLMPDWRTYSLHPGVVDTNIFPSIAGPLFRGRLTPEQGAETLVWCSTSEGLASDTGLYYIDQKVRTPSPAASDDDLAEELWARSEAWCGVTLDG